MNGPGKACVCPRCVCVSRAVPVRACRSVSPVLAFRNTLLSIVLYPLSLTTGSNLPETRKYLSRECFRLRSEMYRSVSSEAMKRVWLWGLSEIDCKQVFVRGLECPQCGTGTGTVSSRRVAALFSDWVSHTASVRGCAHCQCPELL